MNNRKLAESICAELFGNNLDYAKVDSVEIVLNNSKKSQSKSKNYLAFFLSMPNVGSWDSKWSGVNNLYCVVHNYTGKKRQEAAQKILKNSPYYYNFGNGWSASIEVKAVDSVEVRKLKKNSSGFAGYDWMISSIMQYQVIYGPTRPKPENA